MSSSATRPPMVTSSIASSCFLVRFSSSFSGSCMTIPRDWPRGTIVALCIGLAPSVNSATSAWPPSWYAVSLLFSSATTALFRSAPIMIRSLAYSSCFMPTSRAPSRAARNAATLIRFARSAPEKPGVPRAMTSQSTDDEMTTPSACVCKICFLPSTSGLGTATVLSNLPGRTSALSSDSGVFVAARTMTPSFFLNPSSSVRSWLRVMRVFC
mmetsp:Transcript_8544/g.38846  ORF Transcript_8544/g.38846 Transcript_8544/m.38846 type:complete len:212 (-) Transcript_8544:1488-2123(-)